MLNNYCQNEGVNDDSGRRYLERKPMTAVELLQKYRNKKTGSDPEENQSNQGDNQRQIVHVNLEWLLKKL